MKLAMADTEPLSSISLPNRAPRRKIGKNCMMKRAALPMKVCVQWASSGSPGQSGREDRGGGSEQKHAPAPIGQPDQQPESDKNAEKSHASDLFQQRRRDRGWSGARDPMHASPERLAPTFVPHRAGE